MQRKILHSHTLRPKRVAFAQFSFTFFNSASFYYRLFVYCSLMVGLISCQTEAPEKLTIATAANMQFAIKELVHAFSEESNMACEAVISSSGKLTAQIREGAPFDIFVSADMKYPETLFNLGLVSAPEIYAYGKLVLWSMKENLEPSVQLLSEENIKHIALANPKTAPYGMAAMEVFKHYGIFDKIEHKLVYGESISQTNQFIVSKAADIGLTAKAVILSPEIKGKGKWEAIDPKIYTPIAQGIVISKKRKNNVEKARQFRDFLFSEKGKAVLEKYGYEVPK